MIASLAPFGRDRTHIARWRLSAGFLFIALLFLQACTAVEPKRGFTVVPVWYATDRNPTGERDAPLFFSGKRGTLSYGKVLVSIPENHCVGCLEEPNTLHLEFKFDPEKHVTLLDEIQPMAVQAFWKSVRLALEESEQREIVVFIHGFNVTFDNAARRTGQLFFDLQRPGAAMLYSWPSSGSYHTYLEDVQNAEVTIPNLKEFLRGVSKYAGAEKVSIIAHSKGNEPLIKALTEMVRAQSHPQLQEIVLTAPDIDTVIFKRLTKEMKGMSERVTLYASRGDQALAASKEIAGGYPRAGDATDEVLILDGVETIDASAAETNLFGHSYYAGSRTVLQDISAVLSGRLPGQRPWLQKRETRTGSYWAIKP